MSAEREEDLALLHGALDGTLTSAQESRFLARLADETFADAFARMLLLEEALRHECEAALGVAAAPTVVGAIGRPRRRWVAAAAILVAMLSLLWSGLPERTALAEDLLARIAARTGSVERRYLLHVLDDRAVDRSLDGAVLHIGARGQYVLERRDADGTPIVSGSDGRTAWMVPAHGPVRVSASPTRFRGLLPGEQFDLTFLDPAADGPDAPLGLEEFAQRYTLVLSASTTPGEGPRTIIEATRRDGARRGPRHVRIELDPRTLRIERMRLDRLPQAKDGPRSVLFERLPIGERRPDLFDHAAYHDRERAVRFEP